MTQSTIAAMRRLNAEEFVSLYEAVAEEEARRTQIADLVDEINEKLYKLSGLLTGSDSLRIMNNLTGEIMSDMTEWDEPDDDKLYLAPELDVEIGVERRPGHCLGAPAKCPWD